jgi:putative copper export protein
VLDVVSVALRALSFLFLLQATGVVLFIAIFGRRLSNSAASIRRLGRWSALIGLVCVAAHYGLEAARLAGDLSGMWDTSLQETVLRSASGAAFAVRMLGLSLVALALRRAGTLALALGILGAVTATASFMLVGHTSVHSQRWFLAPLLLVHLLIVAFWIGALLPLQIASWREAPDTLAKLVHAFSGVAAWLVPGILLAGLGLTIFLVPAIEVFRQPYGLLLLVKVAAFMVLMSLAALNKWRLGPALVRGERYQRLAFQRSLRAEYLLLFAALTVTAVMTTFFSPQ